MLVGSLLKIALVLSLKNVDFFFEKIKIGNWSPVLLMALSEFIMGLFGYLPKGLNNWIWWNAYSHIVNNN